MERRKNRRVPFQVMATAETGKIKVNGMVDNLSMKGMFLTTKETLSGSNLLEISIILSGSSSLLSIRLMGSVVRQTEVGIAIEFQEMDLDSFTHLRNVIELNTGDADAAYEEYCRSIMSQ